MTDPKRVESLGRETELTWRELTHDDPEGWTGNDVDRIWATLDEARAQLAAAEADKVAALIGASQETALVESRLVASERQLVETLGELQAIQDQLVAVTAERDEALRDTVASVGRVRAQRDEARAQLAAAQERERAMRDGMAKARSELARAWLDWDADRDVKAGKRIANAADMLDAALASVDAPASTVHIERSKEWWLAKAKLEGDSPVSAGADAPAAPIGPGGEPKPT